jgi:spore coat protein U-like protein
MGRYPESLTRGLACAAFATLVALPGLAEAATCSASATGVSFGIYDASLTLPSDSTGSLTVSCSYTGGGVRDVGYVVTLNSTNSPNPATRWLAAGSAQLFYNLYRNAARTEIWGNGTGGSFVVSGSLKPGPGVGNETRSETYTVYGRVPAQQDADFGNYGDMIVITLTF